MNFIRFRPKEDYSAYYPNNVGTQRPAGRYYYEFLMIGKMKSNVSERVEKNFLQSSIRQTRRKNSQKAL